MRDMKLGAEKRLLNLKSPPSKKATEAVFCISGFFFFFSWNLWYKVWELAHKSSTTLTLKKGGYATGRVI